MLDRNTHVPVTMRDRVIGLAAIVFLASMGGVWLAASHPATTAGDATAQGTFHTADLLVDNTTTLSAMTPSTLMTVNASKQLTPYAGTTLANDGGGTACTIGTGGTGNCNQVVLGASTTPGTIPISLSAPPNNRSIGDNLAGVTISSVSLDMNSHRITSITDPNLPTDQSAATAHWITATAASNFSATQGGTVVSPGVATGKFLRDDNTWQTVGGGVTATQLNSGLFGFGGDGTVTFDGSTTITINGTAIVPSSSTYTLPFSIEGTTITVNNGVTVKEAGYYMKATTLFTNNGIVQDVGNDGGNASVGTDGTAGTARAAGYYTATSPGIVGGNNSSSNITEVPRGIGIGPLTGQAAGTAGAAFSGGAGGNGQLGGTCQGGTGGGGGGATIAAAGGVGGVGGSITLSIPTHGLVDPLDFWRGELYAPVSTNSLFPLTLSGTGGSSGGDGGGSSPNAGGSGAAGGVVIVYAQTIGGNGVFRAKGGRGGNGATGSSSNVGAGGGGGGGGGGIVELVYSHNSGTWTTDVTGGAGGTGGPSPGTGGKGGDGNSGGSCIAKLVNVSGDGT